ncbi:HlyD family secretion protein [Cricetibacter osteomyelitidis]|uniref:HlyD family secretion protein n=1 Tax=Cricetibacter osteomyelitidis TaxID=1521931 RepID=A0A4R2TQH7_9PAST|nr:HlyD family efflux transporter periplasmic adaptor subunit [Cricetibacter osteomyelitidis]TCP97272.1 HlyD family secretion protein [Cricetibacter osteomyelitidis]
MKKIIPLLLIIVVAASSYFYWQHSEQTADNGNIAQSNGRLELNRLDIASLYAGRVQEIFVDEGDNVKKDQILTALSSETANAQLSAAKAQRQQALDAVNRATAQVETYVQQQKVAQLDLDNALKLRKENLVSNSEVTKRRADLDRIKAAVQSAQAAQAEAKAATEAAQAQIDQSSSIINDLVIRSPIDGKVEYRFVELGNVVNAGTRVASLLDPSDVSMNIFVPMTEMAKLKVGDEARIVLDGIDAVFPATISYIADYNQFTPKSVETRQERTKFMFKIKLKVSAEVALKYNSLLKSGMSGNGYVRLNNADWRPNLAVKLPE